MLGKERMVCGRFTQIIARRRQAEALLRILGLSALTGPPRYNIAPTQRVPVVTHERGTQPTFRELQWGLVPAWAKDAAMGARLINARAETIREKPSFREAFKRRRCLVPASGFYEWKRNPSAKKGTPYYFTGADEDAPLAFAGLWEAWEGGGESLHSFTIVTTGANRLMAPVHDRMPVILPPGVWAAWLDPLNRDADGLAALLAPAPEDVLQCWEVSPYVNNVRNEGERCVERVA